MAQKEMATLKMSHEQKGEIIDLMAEKKKKRKRGMCAIECQLMGSLLSCSIIKVSLTRLGRRPEEH